MKSASEESAALSESECLRYQRQLSLPDFAETGQQALKSASVLCVGAGGLGAPALTYLAAAGVGRIGVIDSDRVELSNLHRQLLFTERELGRPKVEVAAARLRAINPHITVEPYEARLSEENALQLFSRYDLIVDGSDNFPTRYLVNDAAVLCDRPFVYGAISGFEGQVSVFNDQGGPTYRCLFGDPPPQSLFPPCAEAGVLGVLPAVIGSLMATEAIKLITSVGESLSGRLLTYDARRMSFQSLSIPARSSAPVTALRSIMSSCGVVNKIRETERLSVEDFLVQRSREGETLIDVRTPQEFKQNGLKGAFNLPLSTLEGGEAPKSLSSAAGLLIYCQSGQRSARAVELLRRVGVPLAHLEG
ncbi:MAG: HesA/MoeB/ThiF family protein, partial [Myxococcota bacterium]|nr:HesA/MoeB/ThiF family protein [Myxococcota bacterium]